MSKLLEDDPHHMQWLNNKCLINRLDFKATIMTLKQRFNQSNVSLLQKTHFSLVTCHATGFYPDRALMFWRKDGEELHEGAEKGEILPNNDGTFQMSVGLNVSSVTGEDWRRYDCVFQFSGLKDCITTKLDRALIRTNQGSFGLYIGIAIGAVLMLLAVLVCAVFVTKRRISSGE
ncbi:hypothetical protein GOODEAATRI_030589 [Goodea atripinnis]|uniref:Ig-like domain-containing protein n=1 Tax=Goodea atripinnis TaxID=208336 RepID=A0ABV0NZ01_9TELE